MPGDYDQVYLAQDTPLPCDPPAGLCLLPPGLCSASTEEERRRGRPPAGLQGLQAGTAGRRPGLTTGLSPGTPLSPL